MGKREKLENHYFIQYKQMREIDLSGQFYPRIGQSEVGPPYPALSGGNILKIN